MSATIGFEESIPPIASPDRNPRLRTLYKGLAFTATRYAANLEFAGGVGIGLASEPLPLPARIGIAATTACGVTLSEYHQSNVMARLESKPVQASSDNEYSFVKSGFKEHVKRGAKELIAFASASWQGAGGTVPVNERLGLESTPKRRKLQSAVYGAWIGLWASPLPIARKISSSAVEVAQDISPKTLAAGALTSAALFTALSARRMPQSEIVDKPHTDYLSWGSE